MTEPPDEPTTIAYTLEGSDTEHTVTGRLQAHHVPETPDAAFIRVVTERLEAWNYADPGAHRLLHALHAEGIRLVTPEQRAVLDAAEAWRRWSVKCRDVDDALIAAVDALRAATPIHDPPGTHRSPDGHLIPDPPEPPWRATTPKDDE